MGALDDWTYCPRCSGALEPEDGHLGCTACGEHWYANPLPAVQGVVERDGKVLLALRAHEPRRGYWDLPGGFVEEGETPVDALRREFLEETGLEVEPLEILRIDIEPYQHRQVFSVTYAVRAEDGEPVAADDVAELHWFASAELPGELAFPGQDAVLADWVRRQQHA